MTIYDDPNREVVGLDPIWTETGDNVPDPIVATGATAGTPGTFTPPGCEIPANLTAMSGIVATPSTAWTVGQNVVLGNASLSHWSGTAWAVGAAP